MHDYSNQTCLDRAEWGDVSFLKKEKLLSGKERRKLPDGFSNRDLYKDVMKIALPSLFELILTSLTSMVDMMMVGSMAEGDAAISAVSLASQPKFIFVSLTIALNAGVTANIARARGAQEHEKAGKILCQGLLIALILSIFCSIIGWIASPTLVLFMANGSIQQVTVEMSVIYLRIQMAGFLTLGISTVFTAALRGAGDSRTPMIYNVTANVINICLNYLLINGHFGFSALGVAGASIATVLGQAAATIMAVLAVSAAQGYFHLTAEKLTRWIPVNQPLMSAIMKVGMPALIEQAIIRVGLIIFTRKIAALGDLSYTTHNICMNILTMSFLIGQAFAISATTLVGQSLGKSRPDFAEHYAWKSRNVGLLFSIVVGGLCAIFGRYIVGLYTDTDAVLAESVRIMIILGILQPFQNNQFILAGALRGAGDTVTAAVITFIGIIIIRVGAATLFLDVLSMGLVGAWLALSSDQLFRTALISMHFKRGKWKKIIL